MCSPIDLSQFGVEVAGPPRTIASVFNEGWESAEEDVHPRVYGAIYRSVRKPAKIRALILHTRLGDAAVYINHSGDVVWTANLRLMISGLIPYGTLSIKDLEILLGLDSVHKLNLGERINYLRDHLLKEV